MSSQAKPRRRKDPKVQTRIAFEPASSSAPAEDAPSPSRVAYENPRGNYAASNKSSRSKSTQSRLPFPAISHNVDDSDIDDDGIPAGKKFAVVICTTSDSPASSPVKSANPKSSPSHKSSFMPRPKSMSKLKHVGRVDSSSDGEPPEDDEVPVGKLKKMPESVMGGRYKPSFLTDSDEEPLERPPQAAVVDGRVIIPGEATPSPSPEPGDVCRAKRKYTYSKSYIKADQLGRVRDTEQLKPGGHGRAGTREKTKKTDEKEKGKKPTSAAEPLEKDGKKSKESTKAETLVISSDSDVSEDDSDGEPIAASTCKAEEPAAPPQPDPAEDSYDSEPAEYLLPHQAKKAQGKLAKNIVIAPKDTPVDNDDDGGVPLIAVPAAARRRRISPPPLSSDEDEDDDDRPTAPTPARQKRVPSLTKETSPSPPKAAKRKRVRSPTQSSTSSDDDDSPVAPTPANKRRKITVIDSDDEEDADVEMVELGDDVDKAGSEADSLFGDKKSPRRLANEKKTADAEAKAKKQAKADMKGKNNAKTYVKHRLVVPKKNGHRTPAEKAKELMLRRRAGEKILQVTDTESSSEEEQRGMYDTNSEDEVLSHFADESEEENQEQIRRSVMNKNKNKHKNDSDDDDFIVEDDEVPLGVPDMGLHSIPLEFTHQAHKPMKEHFKDVIEWMIKRRINPSFDRKDPIYVQAFNKLNDDPTGLVNSKLVSSIWNAKFVRALKTRPEYQEESTRAEGKKCSACGRGKDSVSWVVTLKGKPYNKDTLDLVDQSDAEDDDEDSSDSGASGHSDSSGSTIDSKGNVLPSAKKRWYMGQTCHANAMAAHGLIHWKHFLDDWVLDALHAGHYLDPEKLAERLAMTQKKLNQLAEDITDEWTRRKEIKKLYEEFKKRISEARNMETTRWGRK